MAKLSPSGEHLWSTHLGGDENESGSGIAVDAAGNALVTGSTYSAGWVSGGFDTTLGGDWDAFVAKILARPRVPGDVNGDGQVDDLDVAPFFEALLGGSYIEEADMNYDGRVTDLDVTPFEAAVRGATTGGYSVRLILGAAVEMEKKNGSTNDSIPSAQDLDGSFHWLGVGSAERGAVLGSLAVADGEDWYRFSLEDGQSATLALATSGSNHARLELYDSGSNLLATGVAAANADQMISDFADPTSDGPPDAFFVRVVGDAGEYGLLVTKDADFDTEPNDDLGQETQDIGSTGTVLGAISVGESAEDSDHYSILADAGYVLSATTLLPAAGPGQFVNELDVAVELYDPSGALVASDPDGSLAHTAMSTGLYTVRVLADSGTSGEYLLRVVAAPKGDMNLDGTADLDDVDGLVLALRAPAQYEALYGLPPSLLADTDGDGDLDFDDISGFVAALNGAALTAGSRAVAAGGGLGPDAASGDLGPGAADRVQAEEVGGWITVQPAWTAPAAAVQLDQTLAPAADLEGDLAAAVAPVFLGQQQQQQQQQRAGQDWASELRSRPRHPADPLAATTNEELAAVWSVNEDWLERAT